MKDTLLLIYALGNLALFTYSTLIISQLFVILLIKDINDQSSTSTNMKIKLCRLKKKIVIQGERKWTYKRRRNKEMKNCW